TVGTDSRQRTPGDAASERTACLAEASEGRTGVVSSVSSPEAPEAAARLPLGQMGTWGAGCGEPPGTDHGSKVVLSGDPPITVPSGPRRPAWPSDDCQAPSALRRRHRLRALRLRLFR